MVFQIGVDLDGRFCRATGKKKGRTEMNEIGADEADLGSQRPPRCEKRTKVRRTVWVEDKESERPQFWGNGIGTL